MLKKELVANPRPIADKKNVVLWQDYRVSVLGGRLFRLEKSKAKNFRDLATQAVWFRDVPPQYFTVEITEKTAVIDTGECKLILSKTRGQVCVEMCGKRIAANNTGNLLGTYRTLDNCNGEVYSRPWIKGDVPYKIKLENGVCSKTGVAVLDDSFSLSLGENGEVKKEFADGSDEYIFAFGQDYIGAVCALYSICGYPPLLPRFALGNWWSRYHAYTDEEYLRLLTLFRLREIPLSVATIDMDWHYSENVAEEVGLDAERKKKKEYVGECEVNLGWTGYTWNKNLFPCPKDFLEKAKEFGVKITLNLHPSDGVRFWEDGYEKMANAVGREAFTQKQIPFEFTSEHFINAYFSVLHHPLEKDGVDFWWIDWQQKKIAWQGETERDYDPLWALNHYHYLDNAKDGETPLILSRYAGIGSHRYPVGFSGDTEISWETLAFLPYFTATASNVGYTWWSHDIGGHNFGKKEDELYVRHVQYGVFSPINRLHCSCDPTITKAPWAYGNGAGEIAANFLRLRHQLVPYLYSAAYRTHTEGRALVEPLYYYHKENAAYHYKTEYYFGGELLILPVLQPRKADGYARVKGWLPQGVWTDIFTGDEYEILEKGREVTLFRQLDNIPALIKSGGILPLSKDGGNGCDNPENLEVWCYTGNGEFTLYEDGKAGELKTYFSMELSKTAGACTQSLTIIALGSGEVIPVNRKLAIRFKKVQKALVRLFVNGEERAVENPYAECAGVDFNFEIGKTYKITAEFAELSRLEKLLAQAKNTLTLAQEENERKRLFWLELQAAKEEKEYLSLVEESGLSQITKARLKESL